MAITQYYVDPAINANSGTGTIGDPFGDLQYALNTVTRDATNGDQFNIKAGTAEILTASLTLATYGAPAEGKPLVLRGYTSAANDGGRAEINCNGSTMFASTAYGYVCMIDLQMHSFGNNHGVGLNGSYGQLLLRCEVHKGSSSPSSKYLVNILGDVVGSYIHDAGTNGTGIYCYAGARDNYIKDCSVGITGWLQRTRYSGNIISGATTAGLRLATDEIVANSNIIFAIGSTGKGIEVTSGSSDCEIVNNIIEGYSGAGGVGISAASPLALLANNAIYNCTTAKSLANVYADMGTDILSLSASPFTDAANGDFSLTDVAKAVLRSEGWPASYLGAHANSDPHITIGPMQYGPAVAGGGAVRILPLRGILG